MTNSLTNYSRFTTPVTYNSDSSPDSLQFIIFASNPSKYYPGNVFYVDDLSFIYNTTTKLNENTKHRINVFTNKESDRLNIFSEDKELNSIRIFDICGRNLQESSITKSHEIIDISHFVKGIYLYQIINMNGIIIQSDKFTKR